MWVDRVALSVAISRDGPSMARGRQREHPVASRGASNGGNTPGYLAMTPASLPQERHVDEVDAQDLTDAAVRPGPGTREPLVRQVIDGRYRVVDTLGTGSLGTVYLCDEIPTTKRVAVKVFRRDCSKDEEFVDRLHRQVKLAMSLQEDRPTILAVSDCGRTRDGGAYLATEYLQGRTLKDIIRRGAPLDVQRALGSIQY